MVTPRARAPGLGIPPSLLLGREIPVDAAEVRDDLDRRELERDEVEASHPAPTPEHVGIAAHLARCARAAEIRQRLRLEAQRVLECL